MINVDQKYRITRAESTRAIHYVLMVAILTICLIAAFNRLSPDDSDYLISPDAASYMHKRGSGFVFDDMDVE